MVEGVSCPEGGDKITVSHANFITLIWLKKIHPELVSIVKTEYSMELRDNKPLSSLVSRISVNIDNLLAKYDKIGQINLIKSDDDERQLTVKKTFIRRNMNNKNREPYSPFCPGCFKLNKSLGKKLHFQHVASECPRQTMVKLLQLDDINCGIEQLELCETDDGYQDVNADESNSVVQQISINSDIPTHQSCFSVNI